MIWVGRLPTLVLVMLLGLLSLSPMTLASRRWGMWVILDLMSRALAAKTPLDQMTLPGIMSHLPTSIARYPRSSVGVLVSTYVASGVVVSRRPLVRFLQVEVFSLISLPLNSTLLIEVIISLLHRPLYINCGIVQVYIRGVLTHNILFLMLGLSLASNQFILTLSLATKAGAKRESSLNLEACSSTLIPPCCSCIVSFSFDSREICVELILDQLFQPPVTESRLVLPFSHSGSP